MGRIEERSEKRRKKANIQRAILSAVSATGLLAVAVVTPGAIKVLKTIDPKLSFTSYNSRVERSLKSLLEKGYVKFDTKGEKKILRITSQGERYLTKLESVNYLNTKLKKWDGKYRVLIFDIKEHRRGLRDKLRRTLISIGFMRLQNSVWVYPYDCEDLITLIKLDYKTGKDVLYMIVDEIEYDKNIRSHFGLAARQK